MPPQRDIDHSNNSIHGAQPVNQVPYHYLLTQKNESENLDKEFLAASIIQNYSCPYASPIFLLKKRMKVGMSALITGLSTNLLFLTDLLSLSWMSYLMNYMA